MINKPNDVHLLRDENRWRLPTRRRNTQSPFPRGQHSVCWVLMLQQCHQTTLCPVRPSISVRRMSAPCKSRPGPNIIRFGRRAAYERRPSVGCVRIMQFPASYGGIVNTGRRVKSGMSSASGKEAQGRSPVSYTHLTLPTIYSV